MILKSLEVSFEFKFFSTFEALKSQSTLGHSLLSNHFKFSLQLPPNSKFIFSLLVFKMFRYPARRVTPADNHCSICKVSNRNLVPSHFVITPCRHEFHSDCLEAWMRIHRTCPLCRRNLLPSAPSRSPKPEKSRTFNCMFH